MSESPTRAVLPEPQMVRRYLPDHATVTAALPAAVGEENGGIGNHVWATLVNRDGVVQVVTYSGGDRGAQWPGARVLSAQKAYTANAWSSSSWAYSTVNLVENQWVDVHARHGSHILALQDSNPVNSAAAYKGPASMIGSPNDPMVDACVGGFSVFGGELALYASSGAIAAG